MKRISNDTLRADHAEHATPPSSPLRLLPWLSLDGKPCYLVADDNGGGYLSRLADELEAGQLATAVEVLGLARPLLDDPESPYTEVRYAGLRLAECLTDALRVAESRGMRPARAGRRGRRTEPSGHRERTMVVTTTRRRSSPVTAAHAAEPTPAVPPMPERNAKALREAIAEHAPQLLPDFDEHWKWAVADAYDISTVPAFMARWWGQYAIARDPRLDAHVTDLEHRAAESADITEAKALLEEASNIRHQVRRLEPGR